MPWPVLAGIGAVETDHGRSSAPGVHAGVNRYGCCAGPMQFNITDGPPSSWARYRVDADHDGVANVYDPDDAINAAGNYLHALLANAHGDLRVALLGYNHSPAYVNIVLAHDHLFAAETNDALASSTDTITEACAGGGLDAPAGPAELKTAVRVDSPRSFTPLPAWAMAAGRAPEAVDTRVYADVVWILRRYHLRVTAAREAGHHTHGDGTAVDLVPADDTTQPAWDASTGRLAQDLGWTPQCAATGSRPVCPLAPAIQFVGYDGYPAHGSPRTCRGAVTPTCTSHGARRALAPAGSGRPAGGSAPSPRPQPQSQPALKACQDVLGRRRSGEARSSSPPSLPAALRLTQRVRLRLDASEPPTGDAMSLLDTARELEGQVVERLKELEPLIAEYNHLRTLAERLGVSYAPPAEGTATATAPTPRRAAKKSAPRRSAAKPRSAKRTSTKRAANRTSPTRPTGTTSPRSARKTTPAKATPPTSPAAKPTGRRRSARKAAGTRPGQRTEDVLRVVGEQPGISVREIGERLGVDATGLYRVANKLTTDGRLRKAGTKP